MTKIQQLEAELGQKVDLLDSRITNIEAKIDTIANNHLSHIQRYITWILGGGAVVLLSQIWMIARLL